MLRRCLRYRGAIAYRSSFKRRIASILGAYDDLIEVNRRRIAVLEEMARRLFDEWFVQLRFPSRVASYRWTRMAQSMPTFRAVWCRQTEFCRSGLMMPRLIQRVIRPGTSSGRGSAYVDITSGAAKIV